MVIPVRSRTTGVSVLAAHYAWWN